MEKMFKGLSIYDIQQQYGTNESCIDAEIQKSESRNDWDSQKIKVLTNA